MRNIEGTEAAQLASDIDGLTGHAMRCREYCQILMLPAAPKGLQLLLAPSGLPERIYSSAVARNGYSKKKTP